jgi:hypothetical protein
MNARIRYAFLALILAQTAHSIEECLFRLYDVFAPARFFSSLVSKDLPVGFAIVNTSLVLFGFWCYFARVRPGHPSAAAFVWFWIILEMINGIGHPFMALTQGGYFPGVVTGTVLLVISTYLAFLMIRNVGKEQKTI